MRDRQLAVQIEECLHRLDLGEDLLDVLIDYPDQGERLKSILLVAMASRAFPLPNPNRKAQRAGKNQMLEKMNPLQAQGGIKHKSEIPAVSRLLGNLSRAFQSRRFTKLTLSYRLAMVALVLFASGGFLTITASASSQPGDMLYPLRKGMVRVQQIISYAMDFSLPSNTTQIDELDIEAGSAMRLNSQKPGKQAGIRKDIWEQLDLVDEEKADSDLGNEQETTSPGSNREKGNDNGNKFGQGKQQGSDQFTSTAKGNPGKKLGHEKENPGSALGNNKDQGGKPEKVKDDKDKDKDKEDKDKEDKDKDKDK